MTPFSKVKTWIKQGFYEKLPNSKSLRGALDLQQEIMDSMIREGLLLTVNCCDYFPTFPLIAVGTEQEVLPVYGLAFVLNSGTLALASKKPDGTIVYTIFGAI